MGSARQATAGGSGACLAGGYMNLIGALSSRGNQVQAHSRLGRSGVKADVMLSCLSSPVPSTTNDRCPEVVGCGGTQTLERTVVVRPNDCGIRCPELSRMRMCSQFKCPIDCVMSRWSGFSKCSKECEGGVQAESRAVITRHKNGGNQDRVRNVEIPIRGDGKCPRSKSRTRFQEQ